MDIDSGFSNKKFQLKQLLPWIGHKMAENNWERVKIHTDEISLQLSLATKQERIQPTITEKEEVQLLEVKAPMTGTYYAASSPHAPAFVKIGEYVKVGQTLCIIEAMKLMNTIESEHEGEIVQILVSNAQMVTAGQVMMKIRP